MTDVDMLAPSSGDTHRRDAIMKAKDRRARQSVCAVCGGTVGVGKATVLEFGGHGRVHTKKCLQKALVSTLTNERAADDLQPVSESRPS